MTITEAKHQRKLWAERIVMSNGGMLVCMLLLPVAIYANAEMVLGPFICLAANGIYQSWKGYDRINKAIIEWEQNHGED